MWRARALWLWKFRLYARIDVKYIHLFSIGFHADVTIFIDVARLTKNENKKKKTKFKKVRCWRDFVRTFNNAEENLFFHSEAEFQFLAIFASPFSVHVPTLWMRFFPTRLWIQTRNAIH